ncbi:MAG: SDR family NAD(P)-dependent oxidoreductase, partial [Actinomycetota bacterium]|nr:SDR family NAD(P)-dependent oxidoreductase [Actinomycetota bacterium]
MGAFEGKAALVTGAGSGIGRAVASRLSVEGASVVVAEIDEPSGTAVAEDIGGMFVRTDVSVLSDLQHAVERSVAAYGRLDIVHLNAGITTGDSSMKTLTESAYRKAVGVNLDGVVYGVMAAGSELQRGGAIVATASLAGLVAYPGDPVYALTKHAVVGFVRAI